MIGHVDADCFYVSAERVRHQRLRGLPVGVLGNHGACIIAKSYEMKAAGVTTGMPIWDAVPLCPEGVYVKRDFRWYETLSRQMLSIVQKVVFIRGLKCKEVSRRIFSSNTLVRWVRTGRLMTILKSVYLSLNLIFLMVRILPTNIIQFFVEMFSSIKIWKIKRKS